MVATTLAATALMAGCGGTTTTAGTDSSSSGKSNVFAYTSQKEVVVADGMNVLAREGGSFDLRAALTFTSDAKFVFWNEGSSSDGTVVTLSADSSGQGSRISCGCRSAVPIGGSEIAWLQSSGKTTEPDAVMRVDISVPNPKPTVWRTIPAARDRTPAPGEYWIRRNHLLAAHSGNLLLSRTDTRTSDSLAINEPFMVSADGTLKEFGPIENTNRYISAATISPDGRFAALVSNTAVIPDKCDRAIVSLIDLSSGAPIQNTTPAVEGCSYARFIRWDNETGPSVTIQRSTETDSGSSTARWQYDQRWSQLPEKTITDTAKTTAGATVELATTDASGNTSVFFVKDGQRQEIAKNSFVIAVPSNR
ncbi:hypothetical protein [Nocardia huaxiensis]|uniref:hypothetical protein n=1 Tax=Nocardia huaxiensis TaxID=2755382 RepID=UPI001E41583A|nr:hypothetical protein [Nocardia huaxiensis]UFS93493.1 hypothetical protein LPY97_21970 [Nocardia huaxiensis]